MDVGKGGYMREYFFLITNFGYFPFIPKEIVVKNPEKYFAVLN